MGKRPKDGPRRRTWFVCLAGAVLFLTGCATPSTNSSHSGEGASPVIQSIKVNSALERTVVEVFSGKTLPYTAFKLMNPPRVVLDIEGAAGKDLPMKTSVYSGNIREILFEQVKDQPAMTRMTIALVLPLEHEIQAKDNAIRIALSPKQAATPTPAGGKVSSPTRGEETKEAVQPTEPRIFFDAKRSDLNQVLGVDFTMLGQGKSRITVTTDRKTTFDLDRKGNNALILKVPNSAIPSPLLREIDSSQFEGVVERIRPAYSPSENQVTFAILMKEMVPYHVDQNGKGIQIDFGPTTVKPPVKLALPMKTAQAPGVGAKPPAAESSGPGTPKKEAYDPLLGPPKKGYSGTPMTMDFVNADVTNILRLLGEISNLNIVWGPEVKGTVSMRLKNVPWDQALDLVLSNNSLAKREEGNVIWVTTKAQLTQLEAEERRKKEDRDREVDERLKRERAEEQREEMETAYLTVNYKDVNNIRDIIDRTVRSETGKITVDPQTKTIIYYDRLSKIQEARSLKERLDQATKQVMIEARIIEADSTFSRSLGVQWANTQAQRRSSTNTTWAGAPPWAIDNVPADFAPGSRLSNPTFATGFSGVAFPRETLGYTFTKLANNGLFGIHLDAALALAESEGKTRMLSAPKIVTRDTVKATIQQGTKIVIPSGTDANGNKTYQQVDASLKLEVKPLITPNDMVVMEVVVKDDNPDYANAIGENVPIKTKEATTTMMVSSGETVVIGGIYKEADTDNQEGIPGLSKIPLLGWFFKAETDTSRRVELLIFLTPTVLTL